MEMAGLHSLTHRPLVSVSHIQHKTQCSGEVIMTFVASNNTFTVHYKNVNVKWVLEVIQMCSVVHIRLKKKLMNDGKHDLDGL